MAGKLCALQESFYFFKPTQEVPVLGGAGISLIDGVQTSFRISILNTWLFFFYTAVQKRRWITQ